MSLTRTWDISVKFSVILWLNAGFGRLKHKRGTQGPLTRRVLVWYSPLALPPEPRLDRPGICLNRTAKKCEYPRSLSFVCSSLRLSPLRRSRRHPSLEKSQIPSLLPRSITRQTKSSTCRPRARCSSAGRLRLSTRR